MRNESTFTEIIFWVQVTKGRFHNIDFDRQRVIGNYIVDFYVHKLRGIIEIDGDSHKGKERYDAQREADLTALGLTIYRIDASDVKYRIKTTMFKLEQFILERYGTGESESEKQNESESEMRTRAKLTNLFVSFAAPCSGGLTPRQPRLTPLFPRGEGGESGE